MSGTTYEYRVISEDSSGNETIFLLAKVIRPDINEAVILNYGEGIVSEAEESEGAEGEASEETNLADLRFRVKVSSLEPHAEVSEMVLLDSEGEMRIPGDLSSARLSLLPNQVLLKHNYPNPFNPITTIRYGIPEDARVSILVYNILGQQVAQLVNELQPTGFYTIAWDGRDTQGRTRRCAPTATAIRATLLVARFFV